MSIYNSEEDDVLGRSTLILVPSGQMRVVYHLTNSIV
jgi:hypothetical protein